MRTMMSLVLCLAGLSLLAGCGDSGGPAADKNYAVETPKIMAEVKAMFDRTKGDYDQLTADEKAVYIKSFAGNEEAGKVYWDKMKSGTANQNVPGAAAPK